MIQIGTDSPCSIYFCKDIGESGRLGAVAVRPELRGQLDARMGWFIVIGSLPIVVLGRGLKDVIERGFRSLWIIGTSLIVLGVVLGSQIGWATTASRSSRSPCATRS